MKGYVISDIAIADAHAFERYKPISARSIARHGGRFLVRGGGFDVIEGDWQPSRISVVEFPSVEAAKAWIESSDYAPAKSIRQRSAKSSIIIVEGGPQDGLEAQAQDRVEI